MFSCVKIIEFMWCVYAKEREGEGERQKWEKARNADRSARF